MHQIHPPPQAGGQREDHYGDTAIAYRPAGPKAFLRCLAAMDQDQRTYREERMSGKYILEGHTPVPCENILTWGAWYETSHEARRVSSDVLPDGVRVSTVFLGLDHGFGEGTSELFETMIFGGEHDGFCERYPTWENAEAGHKRAVAMCLEA